MDSFLLTGLFTLKQRMRNEAHVGAIDRITSSDGAIFELLGGSLGDDCDILLLRHYLYGTQLPLFLLILLLAFGFSPHSLFDHHHRRAEEPFLD
jgi:hypothetical protein